MCKSFQRRINYRNPYWHAFWSKAKIESSSRAMKRFHSIWPSYVSFKHVKYSKYLISRCAKSLTDKKSRFQTDLIVQNPDDWATIFDIKKIVLHMKWSKQAAKLREGNFSVWILDTVWIPRHQQTKFVVGVRKVWISDTRCTLAFFFEFNSGLNNSF